jgi:hypothetical protein
MGLWDEVQDVGVRRSTSRSPKGPPVGVDVIGGGRILIVGIGEVSTFRLRGQVSSPAQGSFV